MSFKYLRTLTEKSTLGFGKYSDLKVGDLIVSKKHGYLIWVYYNCSMIDYNDEVLQLLHIDEEWQIDKPGIEPGKDQELLKYYLDGLAGRYKFKLVSHNKRVKKAIQRERCYRYRNVETKASLQGKNQGHK